MPVLAVVGSAPCAMDDVLQLCCCQERGVEYLAVGIDAAALKLPWKFGATYHHTDIKGMKELGCASIIHHEQRLRVDIVEPLEDPYIPPSGSSAMLGTLAAIKLGYTRIVLCGCPLTGKGKINNNYEMFRGRWEKQKDELAPFVRSMSGWTRDLLGYPDHVWLNGW